MGISPVRISAGLRVGFWNPQPREFHKPFRCVGHYAGPDLGEQIPGTLLQQALMEGVLNFRVGVLFRPDLGRRQSLETILVLENYFPEMFDYETWEKATG